MSSRSNSNKIAGKTAGNGNAAKAASSGGSLLPNKKISTKVASRTSSNKIAGKAAGNGNTAKPAVGVCFTNLWCFIENKQDIPLVKLFTSSSFDITFGDNKINKVLGDSNVLENIIGYLTVHDMKQLRFSVAGLINVDMSHVKRKICAANPDAYFWHYQDLFGRLVKWYNQKLNVQGVMMSKLQDAEAGIMEDQMQSNKHHMMFDNELFAEDSDYSYVPFPKKMKLVQNPINILCENTVHLWNNFNGPTYHPFIRSISHVSVDIKIKNFIYDALLDNIGLAWNMFKFLDVWDMKQMILALFDNVTLVNGVKLHSELLGHDCYCMELAKKVDRICGLNKRGKLYLMLMFMEDQLDDYQYGVRIWGTDEKYVGPPPFDHISRYFFHNDCDDLFDLIL